MKNNPGFAAFLDNSDTNAIFQHLCESFVNSITIWDYFVNWSKVNRNFKKIEVNLNILNSLIGKKDIEKEMFSLLQEYPEISSAIPILLACRDSNFQILSGYTHGKIRYRNFEFKPKKTLSQQEISEIIEFTRETGLLKVFEDRRIRSIPDYVFGVEVGLDSNARKNRTGSTMETIIEGILKEICEESNLSFLSQATATKIKKEWDINVKVDKSQRRFDFAVRNRDKLYLIETNFYSGGGSKLKSTAGEYRSLFDFVSLQGHGFIWITDGLGWKTTLRPLEETFNHIDYTLNLKMATSGLLKKIILDKL